MKNRWLSLKLGPMAVTTLALGPVTRRSFLGSAGLLLATGVGCGGDEPAGEAADSASPDSLEDEFDPTFDATAVPEDPSYAPLPIIIGALDATSIRAASFVESARQVAWRVWRDGDKTQQTKAFSSDADAGWVETFATGLEKDTAYSVAMFVGEGRLAGPGGGPTGPPVARSIIGRFRTAPADGDTPTLVFGLAASTFAKTSAAIDALALAPKAATLHLGGLCDTANATDLASVQDAWRKQLDSDPLRALFTSASCLTVPSASEFAGSAPVPDNKKGYGDALPAHPAKTTGALYSSHRWGKTAEVFVLDVMTERATAPEPTIVSKAQLDWLAAALLASPCRFKLIMTPAPVVMAPAEALPALSWVDFPADRAALIAAASATTGAMFLTRGLGLGSVHRVDLEGPGAALWELAGPPASDDPYAGSGVLGDGLESIWTGTSRGAATLLVDGVAGSLRLDLIDDAGANGASVLIPA